MGIILFVSCEKNESLTEFSDNTSVENRVLPDDLCNCYTVDLEKGSSQQFDVVGSMTVCNDEDNLYVLMEPDNILYDYITEYFLYIGACDELPTNNPGNNLLFNDFPYQDEPNTPTVELVFPLSEFEACFCVSARIEVKLVGSNGTHITWADGEHVGNNQAQFFNYCVEECCAAITYTQGGWGSPPNGGNPGAYLHANFDAAIGGNVVVGCATNSMTFTSAQAITDFLPNGGPPAALTQDYVDPSGSISVLAGQLLALQLNVSFDTWENGETNLADMTITTGDFSGMTVQEFMDDAQNFFGNCASNSSSASSYNDTATDINEYWDNGIENEDNLGFLSCY